MEEAELIPRRCVSCKSEQVDIAKGSPLEMDRSDKSWSNGLDCLINRWRASRRAWHLSRNCNPTNITGVNCSFALADGDLASSLV